MHIIHRPHTNPYFNLAAEEYLLKNKTEDIFMLWQNEPSIIVGKHQNSLGEINYPYIKKKQIPVIRRISGGGTVFHDLGNLNFTFIQKGEREKLVDFKRYVQPIIEVLEKMGLPARFEGKNDIRVNGLKISGNAEHVYKNRVLHHGTLLINSSLVNLNQAIKAPIEKFSDKGVKSIRSTVTNISDLLGKKIEVEEIKQRIHDHLKTRYEDPEPLKLLAKDILEIEKLQKEKYETWAWNFGYSPKYKFENEAIIKDEYIAVRILVKEGRIIQIKLFTAKDNKLLIQDWLQNLVGEFHEYNNLETVLNRITFDGNSKSPISPVDLLGVLF